MYTIYRYEKQDGKGPYSGTSFLGELLNKHTQSDFHPGLYFDFPMNRIESVHIHEYKCGCFTKEALITWFDGFIEKLKNDNVYMYEIKVKQMITGKSGYQVFFRDEDVISKTKIG